MVYLRSDKPVWCTPKDKLSLYFAGRQRLLEEGAVIWGHVVQANRLLFSPGKVNCPGEVVYCLDFNRQGTLASLAPIAETLYKLKGEPQSSPELTTISEYLANERIRVFGLEVPAAISPDLPCAVSSIFFDRKHLPNGVLSQSFFPIIVSARDPRLGAIVPARYWPQPLLNLWRT